MNDETKNKIRAAHLGKNHSDETKKKISESQRARWDRIRRIVELVKEIQGQEFK